MRRHGLYSRIIELVKAGNKIAIVVPNKEVLREREKQYPELKGIFVIPKVQGVEVKTVFIDELSSQDNCYFDYNEEGYLTCTFNHKIGDYCLMNK